MIGVTGASGFIGAHLLAQLGDCLLYTSDAADE